MKTIVLLNNKGGVGKTATVTTVSHMLATVYDKRVLIVDMDPQGNTSNLFGTTDFVSLIRSRVDGSSEAEERSVGDLLIDAAADPRAAIKHTEYKNLDLLPSLPTLAAVEEKLKADIIHPQQFRLSTQLAKIEEDYDFCLIDCGPSLSILNINALVAADEVYIPSLPDNGSLFGIELTISELVQEVQQYSRNLKIGGIFLTKYKNFNVTKFASELLEAVYGQMLLPITIRDNIAVAECSHKHLPLLAYDNKIQHGATRDYLDLTGYIAAADRKTYLRVLKNRRENK